jgi:hypothetical protein
MPKVPSGAMIDKEHLNVTSAASGLKDNRETSGDP